MKILLTGGSGFIGQHLIDELKDHDLVIMSRKDRPVFWANTYRASIVKGDLSDFNSIKDHFNAVDIVINLAAELKNPEKFAETNIKGIENLLHAMRINNVKRLIHLSSVGVVGMQYNENAIVINEASPCYPKNDYERTKLYSEKLILTDAVEVVILRPTNVFGEHHPKQALLNYFNHINKLKPFFCVKDSKVNYLYVKDLVNAIAFFTENRLTGIFNIGYSTTSSSFVKATAETLNKKPTIITIPLVLTKIIFKIFPSSNNSLLLKLRSLANKVVYDDSTLKKVYSYKYGLTQGIHNTISYYKNEGKL